MEQYYVYHNWRVVKGGKAKIHRGSCGSCNNGQGVHNSDSTKNCKWLGPFKTKQDALTQARKTGAARVSRCRICNP